MSFFILPALIALLAKLAVLIIAYRSVHKSRAFFSMVVVFAAHNFFEVLVFLKFVGGDFGFVITAYYLASIWGLAVMLLYALDVGQYKNQYLVIVPITLAVVLSLGVMFTDLVVGGERALGYVLTAVRGPLYWSFQLYSATMFILVASVLIRGYRNAKTHITEIQCLSTLLALAPFTVSACAIMILMNLGFNLNATTILPIATSAFLVITLLGEAKHNLTDVRRFLPWSAEKKTSNQIMDIFSNYARDDMDYRQAVNDIEKLLVVHKYQKNDENASATAELMGMPRSSLYSIFNRLKIESKGNK